MKCRKCTSELQYDEKRRCSFCPVCNPPQKAAQPTEERQVNNRVDEPWTEERITEIIKKVVPAMIRDELENWHIPKPSVTRAAILDDTVVLAVEVVEDESKNWRATAKALDIPMYDKEKKRPRLKVDVLRDIKEKTGQQNE